MIPVELSVLVTNKTFRVLNPFRYPFVFRPMGVVSITVLGAIRLHLLYIVPSYSSARSPSINADPDGDSDKTLSRLINDK